MKKNTLLALLFLSINAILYAQSPDVEWSYFSANGNQVHYVPQSLINTSDGGSLVVGRKYDIPIYQDLYYVSKFNKDGDLLWESDLSSVQYAYNYLTDAIEVDGGYLLLGYYSTDLGETNNILIQIDSSGAYVGSVDFLAVDSSPIIGLAMLELSDDNLLIYGFDGIFKVDISGNIIWNTSISGNFLEGASETSNGDIYLSGYDYNSTTVKVRKLDASGTLIAEADFFNYANIEEDYRIKIEATADGGAYLAFTNTSSEAANPIFGFDFWLGKLDASLAIEWEQSYGADYETLTDLQPTYDGGLVLYGRAGDFNDSREIFIIKVNDLGTIEWQKTIFKDEKIKTFSIVETEDLGYAFTGYEGDGTTRTFFLYKLEGQFDGGITTDLNADSCSENFIPTITLTNYKDLEITSAEIEYYLDTDAPQTYTWTGSLALNESVSIALPEITASIGNHTFTTTLNYVNGYRDAIQSNGTVTQNLQINQFNTESVSLVIQLDDYPEETSWQLTNSSGTVLYSGNSYIIQGGIVNETFTLAIEECYTFEINDVNGDGITEGFNGYYSLTTEEGETFAQNGNFESSETVNFLLTELLNTEDIEPIRLFSIYPNPVNDILYVSSKNNIEKISMYTINGQLMNVQQPQNNQIDLSNLSSGIYFIKVADIQNNSSILRVIKE